MPLLFIFLLFFNTPCWHWWHSQVSRLFNYVSFSKSHFKLVVRSECYWETAVSSDSEPEVEPFITQTKAALVALLQELSENNLNLHLPVCRKRTSSWQFQFSHRGSFDRPACLQTKKIPGQGSLHNCTWQGNSVEESSKNTTKPKEVNCMSSLSTRDWDDWLRNGTPYHASDTFVEP